MAGELQPHADLDDIAAARAGVARADSDSSAGALHGGAGRIQPASPAGRVEAEESRGPAGRLARETGNAAPWRRRPRGSTPGRTRRRTASGGDGVVVAHEVLEQPELGLARVALLLEEPLEPLEVLRGQAPEDQPVKGADVAGAPSTWGEWTGGVGPTAGRAASARGGRPLSGPGRPRQPGSKKIGCSSASTRQASEQAGPRCGRALMGAQLSQGLDQPANGFLGRAALGVGQWPLALVELPLAPSSTRPPRRGAARRPSPSSGLFRARAAEIHERLQEADQPARVRRRRPWRAVDHCSSERSSHGRGQLLQDPGDVPDGAPVRAAPHRSTDRTRPAISGSTNRTPSPSGVRRYCPTASQRPAPTGRCEMPAPPAASSGRPRLLQPRVAAARNTSP